ncbi:hypothetical protein SLEP1_g58545 [Rubroshorea leprosula]|uniref:Uncharacterized protein n=1 Tax=Rubroshorea leprosula TaxID=152421 RepID=A0AAV5MQV5_9ROSI|nr:hypothetical protein SLEP1_g58545 [Rubroshorea leprosula]
MVSSLSTVRSTPSRTSLAPYKRQVTLHGSSISLPRNGFSPLKIACLQSSMHFNNFSTPFYPQF